MEVFRNRVVQKKTLFFFFMATNAKEILTVINELF